MSGEIEALGGLVTAGMAADALDTPRPGQPVAHGNCANCGASLSGSFCASCGQKAHVHRSLVHVGEEFLHGITHFDGKAWQTLPMLFFRPGRLTRDYIEGKRARYIAPVPLFLLVVFAMFFTFSFVSVAPGGGASSGSDKPLTQAEARQELPKIDAKLADLDRQIAEAKAKGESVALPGLIGARAGVATARDTVKARAEGEVRNPIDLPGAIAEEIGSAGKNGELDVNLGDEALNVKARKALKNPELALYKIQSKAYKFSFLLVPLSLPWLWLMFFWRRDVQMYDHAVFALYSISFMSLLFVIGSLAAVLDISFGLFWAVLIVVAPLAHMFFQLKGAYALSTFGAAWRTGVLALAAVVTLSLYAALMVAFGLLD